MICNLLNYYRGYFNNIYIYSPTVKNDEKWDWVKQQDLLTENKALKKWLQKQKQKEKDDDGLVGNRPKGTLHTGLTQLGALIDESHKFTGRIPEHCFEAHFKLSQLQELLSKKQKIIDLLKDYGQTKHLADRDLMICDDMVGSSLFSGSKDNAFKMLNTVSLQMLHRVCIYPLILKYFFLTVEPPSF